MARTHWNGVIGGFTQRYNNGSNMLMTNSTSSVFPMVLKIFFPFELLFFFDISTNFDSKR